MRKVNFLSKFLLGILLLNQVVYAENSSKIIANNLASSVAKYNLNKMLKEIIHTDSEIKERLSQYNATVEEIGLSEAGYYPKIDFLAKVGRKAKEEEGTDKDTFNHNEVTVKLVQNIFDGFGTTHAVKRDQARARAAYNKYLEVAQDKMYRGIESYLKVLRYTEVLNISKDKSRVFFPVLSRVKKVVFSEPCKSSTSTESGTTERS